MSKALPFLALTCTLWAALPPVAALAQADDRGPAAEAAAPQLPAGHVARYRLTYMKSSTTTAIRSATVVSITNQSQGTCVTSVDWRFGFGSATCTTTLSLGRGQTGEHCSRPLPGAIATCNATCSPALDSIEGNAAIGSNNVTDCDRIGVDARLYYTTGTNDTAVSAVSNPNIVKRGLGNNGD